MREDNESENPAFLKIERKCLIGEYPLRPITVMSCLPGLPADVVQQACPFEQGTVMRFEVVQGVQIVKQPERECSDMPAVGLSIGIFLRKVTDGVRCVKV